MREEFSNFKKFIKGKKVAVVGIGVSNTPLVKFLIELGANIIACDRKESLGDIEEYLLSNGCTLSLGEDYLEGILNADVVFRTPSLLPSNEYLVKAKENGAYVTSEIKELLKYAKGKIFAVTGSDGKTTTTTLIGEILKHSGKKVYIGGNIGTPLFTKIEEIGQDDFIVLELSSFQLMDVTEGVDVSVITNVSPNHLDIHKDYEEYIEAKKNIIKSSKESSIIVLNKDNSITDSIVSNGCIRKFSRRENAFAYSTSDSLYVNNTHVVDKRNIKLKGEHNVENLLTAFAATFDYVSIDDMKAVSETFSGVAHRIEFVREFNGVKYYNDSIASSPSRTLAGLQSFTEKVILICGGYDKNIPFEPLASEGIDKIKQLIVMGHTKEKIKSAFEDEMNKTGKKLPIYETISFEDAVLFAKTVAIEGDVIILSPACASFDMFKNFEERGNKFKEIVNELND
ncbi:UDP-N-acetylmuramoyl-L-alanine--D-glutamate ligase [Clostridium cylindrosporum]|uniref:UDP-N-acetylmuramoylalanine--D-glutamate ligase n=1 Tax=Clostridium cylindrosporum DSM 605 TaxID=1121307 RepID=A0A0J8G3R2_CLOCY|nr:UDP-N-acetylmuramoyl-L-alanine--D-glutamate ligase [Clostridium cylindrosporum]KMT22351.1 UDP-N-acetylmuramoylalanine--D-glutamate ligase MurD [Clostridium cylindrosporum DSM 605]